MKRTVRLLFLICALAWIGSMLGSSVLLADSDCQLDFTSGSVTRMNGTVLRDWTGARIEDFSVSDESTCEYDLAAQDAGNAQAQCGDFEDAYQVQDSGVEYFNYVAITDESFSGTCCDVFHIHCPNPPNTTPPCAPLGCIPHGTINQACANSCDDQCGSDQCCAYTCIQTTCRTCS
jgi:hypothetical protein